MAIAPERMGIGIRRHFTTAGTHPYDEVEWDRRDARITNFRDGTVAFEQPDVEVPATWSLNATNIVAQKYFRGLLGSPEREWSVKQMIDRVADTITAAGVKDGYFVDDSEADAFNAELKSILVNQRAAFNSPVWFNIGVPGRQQQSSACFILSVDDRMDSILNWYVEEGTIFKGGSGSGINLSRIRSSKEHLKGGGTASGPVSFMRGADASAGTIKCLHADTPIATNHGIVPIREAQAGWRVLTRSGYETIDAVHDNGVRPLVLVTTQLGDEVRCTPEHRFLVRSREGEVWREAKDLRDDDFVVADLDSARHGLLQELKPVAVRHHNESTHRLPERLDEGFAMWLGWVFGDGSITTRASANFVALQVGDADADLASRYMALTRSVFGDKIHFFVDRHADKADASVSVRFCSTQVIRFLEVNGLRKSGALDLSVPALIQASPGTVRAAFLAGLFEADGHVSNGYAHLSTASPQLALDVHRLLLSIGIPSRIHRIDDRDAAYGSNPIHVVRVVGCEGVRRFTKLVGFISDRKHRLLEAACARKAASPFESQWYLPHVKDELNAIWKSSADQQLRRAIAPYSRYAQPRRLSLLRARALLERFPAELADTSLARFARADALYQRVTVTPAGEGPTFDLTVRNVHEYLVNSLVTHNSGGTTRRAAKMVILNADHPDIHDFIWCKTVEERKARVLRDAGFDMDLDGKDSHSTQYQNANNSVRVTDEFMQAVLDDADWDLKAVTTGDVLETIKARDLFREIAQAAWECADPGLQYDTTINRWHTLQASGRITASNPCSEYLSVDNSACNLASINLLKFLNDDGSFDIDAYKATIEVVFTAQEILVGHSDYPTDKIDKNTRKFRQLGLGYANLGALLMAQGLAYDSDDGRALAGALTALMTGHAYATSARTAARMGPFAGYAENAEHMRGVLRMHRDQVANIDEELVPTDLLSAAQEAWESAVELGEQFGVKNSQATVLAPTGTISFLLDCDTTGVEPDLGLCKTKKLVGGGNMSIVNQTVPRALRKLGYDEAQVEAIVAYIDEHKSIIGAPDFMSEHLPVFACSMGDNTIHYMGHVRMLGAVQPFISGAVSKTCNVPEDVTVEDIEQLHIDAWKLGVKAIAIYRDNCKVGQPLATTKKDTTQLDLTDGSLSSSAEDDERALRIAELEQQLAIQTVVVKQPIRERLPKKRRSRTYKFRVADCEGYFTVSEYDDGRPGELFLKASKQGSTLAGILDAFSISVSIGLQHGVPLRTLVDKYANMRFEPAGMTDDPELRLSTSIVDYVFRRIAVDYLSLEDRKEMGILTSDERTQPTLPGVDEVATPTVIDHGASPQLPLEHPAVGSASAKLDAPLCYSCGNEMQRAGSCYVCGSCGTTSGCS